MRFWLREVIGWLLVVVGLGVFYLCWVLLTQVVQDQDGQYRREPWLLEVGPLAFIGFVIFRGGIHLLKVAVAARICMAAQERLPRDGERQTRRPATAGRSGTQSSVAKALAPLAPASGEHRG